MWLLFLSLAVLANGFEQAKRKKKQKQIWIFHMKYALYTVELLMNYLHYKSYTFKAYIKTNKQFGRARDARIQTVTGWKIYGHLRAPWNAPGGSKYIKIHHSIAKYLHKWTGKSLVMVCTLFENSISILPQTST